MLQVEEGHSRINETSVVPKRSKRVAVDLHGDPRILATVWVVLLLVGATALLKDYIYFFLMSSGADQTSVGRFYKYANFGIAFGTLLLPYLGSWKRQFSVKAITSVPFLALILFSTSYSFNRVETALAAFTVVSSCAAIFVIAIYAGTWPIVAGVAWFLALANVLSLLVVFLTPDISIHSLDSLSIDGQLEGNWRGIFVHKNFLGQAAAFGALITLFYPKLIGNRFISYAISGICITNLIMSKSSTSLISAIAGILLYAVFFRKALSLKIFARGMLALLGSVLATIYSLEFLLKILGKDSTLTGRTIIWTYAVEKSKDHFLFGTGYGTFDSVFQAQMMADIFRSATHPHSGYLYQLLEVGLVGLVLWLVALTAVLVRGGTFHGDSGEQQRANSAVAFLVSIALCMSLTESSPFIFGTVAGSITFISLLANTRRQALPQERA